MTLVSVGSRARNWARYALRATVEKLVLGHAVRDTPRFRYNDHTAHVWEPEKLEGRVQECDALSGLLLIQNFASPAQLAAIEHSVAEFATTTGPRHSSSFRLHEFDPARFVAPILPKAFVPAHLEELTHFEVFDKADPHTEWLRLGPLAELYPEAEALHETSEEARALLAAHCGDRKHNYITSE